MGGEQSRHARKPWPLTLSQSAPTPKIASPSRAKNNTLRQWRVVVVVGARRRFSRESKAAPRMPEFLEHSANECGFVFDI
jgi:hypothetical protein